jgi:hypothetical protein
MACEFLMCMSSCRVVIAKWKASQYVKACAATNCLQDHTKNGEIALISCRQMVSLSTSLGWWLPICVSFDGFHLIFPGTSHTVGKTNPHANQGPLMRSCTRPVWALKHLLTSLFWAEDPSTNRWNSGGAHQIIGELRLLERRSQPSLRFKWTAFPNPWAT